MSGLYIHIPFCEQRCFYCAFTVSVSPAAVFGPYVERVLSEMQISGLAGDWDTVYFGGGTPSLIEADLLGRLLAPVRGTFREATVEANPGTISEEKVLRYRDLGINRISLGAQSLEDEDLKRAGRLHRAAAVYEDFSLLRRCGFDNINLDLIANLPDQQIETWTRNLDRVLDLRPDHISIYMLDHEEHSAWGKSPRNLTKEEDSADFYAVAESRLEAAGYRHYEISNWALPGRECRHNLGYWSGTPYRGVGVGSHSFDGHRRFWNTSSLQDYAEKLEEGCLPIAGEEILTPAIQLEEAFMLGLRQADGVDIHGIAKRFELQFSPAWFVRAWDLHGEGWIRFDGLRIQLTRKGRLAANSVIEELLWPTPTSISEATP